MVLRITQVKGGMPPGNFATVEIKALNKFQSTGQTRDLAFRDKRQCIHVEYEVELSVRADWIQNYLG